MLKKKKVTVWVASLCAVALLAGMVACSPQQSDVKTNDPKPQVETPAADEYGVITADAWKDAYPNQYKTYMENEKNSPDSGKHNYLELYPPLNTMYKGYAFALAYDEASSHFYSLKSVSETPRTVKKEQLANCITCKTPQFTAMVNSQGDQVYAQKFNDTIGQFTESISCYNCHENDPSQLSIASKFYLDSLGNDIDNVPMDAAVCGQCHNEYYFNGETKVTTNPYVGLDQMTPDAILKYYDDKNYKDWAHADTFAPMIKVQHPEFETIYGGEQTTMAKKGYSCSNCHMGTTKAEDGTEFTSHEWKSPLENKELLENDCNSCHKDLKAEVEAWQAEEEERVQAIAVKIEDMTNKIAAKYADEIAAMKAAKEAGTEIPAASAELAEVQKLQRNAQFYWDFVMVENSEGAHNPQLTAETLDKAEAACDEALAKL